MTKDAKSTPGFLTVWTKDTKTWLEIPPEVLDRPLFFGASFASGLAQGFVLPGMMVGEHLVALRQVGNGVQLVALNQHARAPVGTPLARAVAESYSDSLLGAVPLAAAPHPERKSLLVDAQVLFGGDLVGLQTWLEMMFRLPYALDRGNSAIERSRTSAEGTAITLRNHYAIPKLPAPPVRAPGGPPPNPAALPNPPRTVPDPRSFFVSLAYTLAPLPATPMAARRADQRVGFFTSAAIDFGDEFQGNRRTHLIERWRLEKKDPAATVAPFAPKEPIRVVMDRNIPEKWRDAVRAGVLEWNKAFERAGWRNALVVEQQAADADASTLEGARVLAVRWFAMEGPSFAAVGPSQSDPRTGEILRAAALIPENWVRVDRQYLADIAPPLHDAPAALPGEFARRFALCTYAHDALEHTATALELLALRGELAPDSPEATRYVAESLKDVVMHEVGHALGLRHNFKASTGVTRDQLRDRAFTSARGIANSVMDYSPPNLPLQGEAVADYHMTTLGAYDLWAIEWGYREFAPGEEKAALARLATQADADPSLAYATDEDVRNGDPSINQFDLGDDAIAYAERQIRIARELWARTQARALAADDDYTLYRRNLQRGLRTLGSAAPLLTKYVGGTYTSRALAGSGRSLLTPVPPQQQRAALELLLKELFSSASFRFDPRFMTRLGVDQLERGRGRDTAGSPDFSLATSVLGLQRSALDTLMSEATAARLADAESRVDDAKSLLSYADVQARLRDAVWSEVRSTAGTPAAAPPEIDSLRRNLQREHVRRLAAGLLRPAPAVAADVRPVHRQLAIELEAELRKALSAKGWSAIARAHLADTRATLAEALRAPLTRSGV